VYVVYLFLEINPGAVVLHCVSKNWTHMINTVRHNFTNSQHVLLTYFWYRPYSVLRWLCYKFLNSLIVCLGQGATVHVANGPADVHGLYCDWCMQRPV